MKCVECSRLEVKEVIDMSGWGIGGPPPGSRWHPGGDPFGPPGFRDDPIKEWEYDHGLFIPSSFTELLEDRWRQLKRNESAAYRMSNALVQIQKPIHTNQISSDLQFKHNSNTGTSIFQPVVEDQASAIQHPQNSSTSQTDISKQIGIRLDRMSAILDDITRLLDEENVILNERTASLEAWSIELDEYGTKLSSLRALLDEISSKLDNITSAVTSLQEPELTETLKWILHQYEQLNEERRQLLKRYEHLSAMHDRLDEWREKLSKDYEKLQTQRTYVKEQRKYLSEEYANIVRGKSLFKRLLTRLL